MSPSNSAAQARKTHPIGLPKRRRTTGRNGVKTRHAKAIIGTTSPSMHSLCINRCTSNRLEIPWSIEAVEKGKTWPSNTSVSISNLACIVCATLLPAKHTNAANHMISTLQVEARDQLDSPVGTSRPGQEHGGQDTRPAKDRLESTPCNYRPPCTGI